MTAIPMPQPTQPWTLPSRGPVGMLLFIFAESAVFAVFVAAYLYYLGRSLSDPTPAEVLHFPAAMTVCLLSSSVTIHLATGALHQGSVGKFLGYWMATVLLGGAFLAGTALEWQELITEHHLTIATNLFGSTYYALVGLHASHVVAGMIMLLVVAALGFRGRVRPVHAARTEVISLYWHFVDAVWIVVVTVVYVIGR